MRDSEAMVSKSTNERPKFGSIRARDSTHKLIITDLKMDEVWPSDLRLLRGLVFNLDGLGSRPCPMLLAGISSLVTSSTFRHVILKIQ